MFINDVSSVASLFALVLLSFVVVLTTHHPHCSSTRRHFLLGRAITRSDRWSCNLALLSALLFVPSRDICSSLRPLPHYPLFSFSSVCGGARFVQLNLMSPYSRFPRFLVHPTRQVLQVYQ
ncbi:hypothetical protein BDN72DRAFT_456184 [Pluteus cervinus]|uniref:Uncharacterized protein n=1 Tax=Pluteus cervinus TaxID=181527 RepID=A0ACD3B055_9AGAR|nr:hypothetical protein BDN72DRAFT_456184 [Pluteus cervinus]